MTYFFRIHQLLIHASHANVRVSKCTIKNKHGRDDYTKHCVNKCGDTIVWVVKVIRGNKCLSPKHSHGMSGKIMDSTTVSEDKL